MKNDWFGFDFRLPQLQHHRGGGKYQRVRYYTRAAQGNARPEYNPAEVSNQDIAHIRTYLQRIGDAQAALKIFSAADEEITLSNGTTINFGVQPLDTSQPELVLAENLIPSRDDEIIYLSTTLNAADKAALLSNMTHMIVEGANQVLSFDSDDVSTFDFPGDTTYPAHTQITTSHYLTDYVEHQPEGTIVDVWFVEGALRSFDSAQPEGWTDNVLQNPNFFIDVWYERATGNFHRMGIVTHISEMRQDAASSLTYYYNNDTKDVDPLETAVDANGVNGVYAREVGVSAQSIQTNAITVFDGQNINPPILSENLLSLRLHDDSMVLSFDGRLSLDVSNNLCVKLGYKDRTEEVHLGNPTGDTGIYHPTIDESFIQFIRDDADFATTPIKFALYDPRWLQTYEPISVFNDGFQVRTFFNPHPFLPLNFQNVRSGEPLVGEAISSGDYTFLANEGTQITNTTLNLKVTEADGTSLDTPAEREAALVELQSLDLKTYLLGETTPIFDLSDNAADRGVIQVSSVYQATYPAGTLSWVTANNNPNWITWGTTIREKSDDLPTGWSLIPSLESTHKQTLYFDEDDNVIGSSIPEVFDFHLEAGFRIETESTYDSVTFRWTPTPQGTPVSGQEFFTVDGETRGATILFNNNQRSIVFSHGTPLAQGSQSATYDINNDITGEIEGIIAGTGYFSPPVTARPLPLPDLLLTLNADGSVTHSLPNAFIGDTTGAEFLVTITDLDGSNERTATNDAELQAISDLEGNQVYIATTSTVIKDPNTGTIIKQSSPLTERLFRDVLYYSTEREDALADYRAISSDSDGVYHFRPDSAQAVVLLIHSENVQFINSVIAEDSIGTEANILGNFTSEPVEYNNQPYILYYIEETITSSVVNIRVTVEGDVEEDYIIKVGSTTRNNPGQTAIRNADSINLRGISHLRGSPVDGQRQFLWFPTFPDSNTRYSPQNFIIESTNEVMDLRRVERTVDGVDGATYITERNLNADEIYSISISRQRI